MSSTETLSAVYQEGMLRQVLLPAGYLDAPAAALAPLSPSAKQEACLPSVTIVFCSLDGLKIMKVSWWPPALAYTMHDGGCLMSHLVDYPLHGFTWASPLGHNLCTCLACLCLAVFFDDSGCV